MKNIIAEAMYYFAIFITILHQPFEKMIILISAHVIIIKICYHLILHNYFQDFVIAVIVVTVATIVTIITVIAIVIAEYYSKHSN